MLIKTIPVGQLEENCYVVTDEATLNCAVIDPGDESNTILDYLEDNHLHCAVILLTHGHFDHVGAVDALREETGAAVYMHPLDDTDGHDARRPYRLGEHGHPLREGDSVDVDALHFEVLETPGHTPGSVTLRCGEALFTGDTLFRGTCGRTDLEGGSGEDMLRSLKRLCALPGDYEVYPGHNEPTTLVRERNMNYYCRQAMQRK